MQLQDKQYYQEDEINLKELLNTLWLQKKLIIIVTSFITMLAVIYVFIATPIYEAQALIEIGNYKLHDNNNNNNNQTIYLDSALGLSKKLNVLFIDIVKNDKNRNFKITSISVPKKVNNFIEIKASAISNKIAKQEILKIVKYITDKHQEILDDIKNRKELKIKNISTRIKNIKNKEIRLIKKRLKIQENTLNNYKLQLKALERNVKNIEDTNPILAALNLMQKRDLLSYILQLNLTLIDIRNQKDKLETVIINKLIADKQLINSMLLPHNYKNSTVIGNIITNDYPIKPKKAIIIIITFIVSFMLSIFLIFLIQAIKPKNN